MSSIFSVTRKHNLFSQNTKRCGCRDVFCCYRGQKHKKYYNLPDKVELNISLATVVLALFLPFQDNEFQLQFCYTLSVSRGVIKENDGSGGFLCVFTTEKGLTVFLKY